VGAGQTIQLTASDSNFSGSLKVTNGSPLAITGLYVAPAGYGSWGPNQLSNPIPSGYASLLFGIPPDFYDVMCVYSDATSSIGRNYGINSLSVTSITCY
jgi:hypothetical protein